MARPRPSALAKLEQISPQSMGATLGALEARGLVERHRRPRDGRRVVLSVTEAGLQVLRNRRNARTERLAQALAARVHARGAAAADGGRAADRAAGAEHLMPVAGEHGLAGPGRRPASQRVASRPRTPAEPGRPAQDRSRPADDRYKWVALANTTAGVFMAALDGSIVIIALPAIFRGIHLDPLAPGNVAYLLWMIMGYRLVQAVLVVTLGRLGDMFGRVRIYNAGSWCSPRPPSCCRSTRSSAATARCG